MAQHVVFTTIILAEYSPTPSVARWLSPKPAKLPHEKLLDPAKITCHKFSAKICLK